MSKVLPDPEIVLRAVDLFLSQAYGDTPPSGTVGALLETLRSPREDFYSSPPFARTEQNDRVRLALRLGNRFYQHMKLVIESSPDGKTFLFKADAHDAHLCLPSDHPEFAAVLELRASNERVAAAVEQAWMDAGIPTFKSYLRDDLQRRRSLTGEGIR